MIENISDASMNPEEIKKREQARQKMMRIHLARELMKIRERIPFPGINPERYARLKAFEEEFPGLATPIDELVERFKNEGMKVVFGRDPESGNIHVLPFGSEDIKFGSIASEDLQSNRIVIAPLKELVILSKERLKDKGK